MKLKNMIEMVCIQNGMNSNKDKMINKILIALVLVVVVSGNVYADAQSNCLIAVEKGKEIEHVKKGMSGIFVANRNTKDLQKTIIYILNNYISIQSQMKKNKLTTRDSRVVERKKYGHRKARRSFQFSKR